MSLSLPAPVAMYLAAEKAKNADMLDLCFSDDAVVHDEGRDYRGLDAIRSWQREAHAKYRYAAEPLDASVNDETVRVRTRLTGDFPGSPVELDYTFALSNNKIVSLKIQ
jgi:hypothetical protein